MAGWFYEDGIGEARAALVHDGIILRARIEADDDGPRIGAIHDAKLGVRRPDGRAAILIDGVLPALVDQAPPGVSEGGRVRVEITRQAIPERGTLRPIRARLAHDGAAIGDGAPLLQRIKATGHVVTQLMPHMADALEAAGWSETLDEARTGEIVFPGGRLLVSPTPAMTLIDVDGQLPPVALALAGAEAAARAIVRLGIGGSIGIDLPTLPDKAARQAAAAILDGIVPQPFERTAVNGFGFLQIVRRRTRMSIPERMLGDPAGCTARALLRRAARVPGPGTRLLTGHPLVIARIEAERGWRDALARVAGAAIALQADARIDISTSDVQLDPR